jgi:hypothetical protein
MSLHVHTTPHGANEPGFIERGEAVRRPLVHPASVWQTVVAWLRDRGRTLTSSTIRRGTTL